MMRGVGHGGDNKYAYNFSTEISGEWTSCSWEAYTIYVESNIKMHLSETKCEDMNWPELATERAR
jgi:hypothetical protein